MSTTYFCTDSLGHTYSRHSNGHLKPRYFWAIVYRPPGTTHAVGKANVSYSGKRPYGDGNEVVPVRAYPGRHKVEPKSAVEDAVAAKLAYKHADGSLHTVPELPPVQPSCPTDLAYGELRRAYEWFNTTLFGGKLPNCLITFQRKGPTNLGYYSPNRFSGMIDESVKCDEIALNPTNFAKRSVSDILSTLVHEMVHLQCQHEGKSCRGGYHDRQWGKAMKEIGLHPSNTGMPGGKETGQQMSHYPISGGPFAVSCSALLATGFTLSFADRCGWGGKVGKTGKQGKRSKYVCFECQLAAWAKPDAHLMCADCGVVMDEN